MLADKQRSAGTHSTSAHAPPAVEPFMYGTHYSNVGAVNFFLLRVARELLQVDVDTPLPTNSWPIIGCLLD